uniref:Uncharacterized protein n=1 Tax=Panagrolaimus davidi TaxID=227884 RepID=A0A914PGI7_9BILA
MDNYRTFCCHVKTALAVICGFEIAVVAFTFITKVKHPLMICDIQNISTVDEVSEGRGPSVLSVKEEEVCTTYSLIVLFIIFHSIGNAFALMGIFVEQHRMILPILALLPFNILFSAMFFLSVIVSYFTVKPEYGGVSSFLRPGQSKYY